MRTCRDKVDISYNSSRPKEIFWILNSWPKKLPCQNIWKFCLSRLTYNSLSRYLALKETYSVSYLTSTNLSTLKEKNCDTRKSFQIKRPWKSYIIKYSLSVCVCVCVSVWVCLFGIGSQTMCTTVMKLLQMTQWV